MWPFRKKKNKMMDYMNKEIDRLIEEGRPEAHPPFADNGGGTTQKSDYENEDFNLYLLFPTWFWMD